MKTDRPLRALPARFPYLLFAFSIVLPIVAFPTSPARAEQSCSPDEVTALWTRDRKVFRNSDCSLTAVFGHNLHYQAGPGWWEDVDLSFRREGPAYVMDRHELGGRVTDAGVEIFQQSSGTGIRWLTPSRPLVAGRRVSYADQGLVWNYFTRKTGLKLVSLVTTPQGPQTYAFDYQLLGNAAQLSEGTGGSLESDTFRIPRAEVIGADLRTYEVSPWRALSGDRVAFDFDDSVLSREAFPYVLDPTTTFGALDALDDGTVEKTGNAYPPDGVTPPQGTTTANAVGATDAAARSTNGCPTKDPPCFRIANTLMRWDTSSLPDDATVTAASVIADVTAKADADNRLLTADWYPGKEWPIDPTDYSQTAQSSAIGEIDITTIITGTNEFALTSPGNVSETGYTGLRFHVSGGQPTGNNGITFAAFDHTALPEPQLRVTYAAPPSITSATSSPDPVTAGGTVTFSVDWSDPGDQARAVLCKTGAVTEGVNPSCPGGAWRVGALSSTSPSTAAYATVAADIGTRAYYAFACDAGGRCSSYVTGTFTVQNSTPSITSASDSPDPVTAGDPITVSVGWTDPNPGDQARAVVCKTNQVTSGACAAGQTWASGSLRTASPSTASFSPTAAQHGANTYYAFVCDANNACSSSLSGNFTVQNRTPTISSVSDSPDPVTAGSTASFSVGWSDPGDQVRAVICKTNEVSSGGCAAGHGWTSGNLSSTSPSTASFTPTAAHHGSNTYYAFACDAAGACSPSLSGTFSVQNRVPSLVSVSDSPDPANPGEVVTFSISWTDPEDSVRAVVCKTNSVSSGACPGGSWAVGGLSSSSPSATSSTTSATNRGTNTYYAFACDAANACSPPYWGTFTVNNSTPSITSVSDSPDPVTAGDPVTFTVGWSDPNPGDQARAVICKTDQVTNGACASGQAWSTGNLSSASPSTTSFTPTAAQHGTNTYYAFVCDAANACSSSLSGTYTTQNRAPAIDSVDDSPDPVEVGDLLTFSVSWSDPADAVKAVICKTNEISGGSCPGGAWAVGALSSSSPSTASFKPSRRDEGKQTYYAFACDAGGLCSSSIADEFTAYPVPPVVTGTNEIDEGTYPVYAGEVIEFHVFYWEVEPEPEETHRALICKTPLLDRVNATCEPGQEWTSGPLLRDSIAKAWYQTKWNQVGIVYPYYAFVCDDDDVCSANWSEGTFEVENRPPQDVVVTEYPDPVAPGGTLTFTVEWWDTVGEPVTPIICAGVNQQQNGCYVNEWRWASSIAGPKTTSTSGKTTATFAYKLYDNNPSPGNYQYWALACDSYGACQGALNNPQTFTVDVSGSTGYEGGSDPFAPRCEEDAIFWGERLPGDWRKNAQGASSRIRETIRNMTYDCRGQAVAWSTSHINLDGTPEYWVEFGWQFIRGTGYSYDVRAFLEWGQFGRAERKWLFPYPCPPIEEGAFPRWVITNVPDTTYWNGRVSCDGVGPTTLIGTTEATGSVQGTPIGETGRRPKGNEETSMYDVQQDLNWKGAQQNWNSWTNPTCWYDRVSGWEGQKLSSTKYQVVQGTANC